MPDSVYFCPYCGIPASAHVKHTKLPIKTIAVSAAIFIACFFILVVGLRTPTRVAAHHDVRGVHVIKTALPLATLPLATRKTSPPQVQAVKPDAVEGEKLNYQGYQLIQKRKFAEAVPVLQDATGKLKATQSSAYGYAMFNLAQALRLSGHPKEALPVLLEAQKFVPEKQLPEQELAKLQQVLSHP